MNKTNFKAERILLLGRSGVGKTFNGMKYILELMKKKIFSPRRTLLISYTYKSDPSQKEFVEYCTQKYKNF